MLQVCFMYASSGHGCWLVGRPIGGTGNGPCGWSDHGPGRLNLYFKWKQYLEMLHFGHSVGQNENVWEMHKWGKNLKKHMGCA